VSSPAGPQSLIRRLFTLSGTAPLGAFLVLHAITNSRATSGEASFLRSVAAYDRVPGLFALELVLIYVPLLFHAAYGTWLVVTRKALAEPVARPQGWPLAMRATGVVGGLFVLAHLLELRFRIPGARPTGGQLLTWLTADLSSTFHGWPLVAAGYLFASACTTFHFAAGTWAVFARSPLGENDSRARRGTAWAAVVGAVVLWLAFANTVVLHATGARLFGSPAAEGNDSTRSLAGSGEAGDLPSEAEPCPPAASAR
jgi:succinate dehydrogenase / fumarate reductase cytochrome b subunit